MKTGRDHRGMSLLIVLAFIVIVSVLVVGFAESMRLLRPAAASHLERARADQYAWSGVERVIATLNQQTADTNRNWITQPGQLITGALADDAATSVDERKVLANVVPLYSGPAVASADPVLAPPNLNVVTYRDPTSHLITEKVGTNGSALPMQVGWIYIRKNGDMDTSASPAISATNEIVGRYAYWTDDESSKINDNIAWGRAGNTNPPGDPTRIELTALTNFTQPYADTMHKFITNVPANTPYNFFNTPLDARRVDKVAGGSGVAAALNQNKFDVTHFNADPNTTFFGEPRIVLTTHPNLAGWTNRGTVTVPNWVGVNGKNWADGGQPRYIRILKDPEDTRDPGGVYSDAIDTTKLSETIATIAYRPSSATNVGGYLQRSDWPMVNGPGSFQSKYYPNYPTATAASGISGQASRLGQIAINVIDYVRAKESTTNFVFPTIGYFDVAQSDPAKAFVLTQNGDGTNGYAGLTRGPRITEFGLWYGTNTGPAFTPPASSNVITNGALYYLFKVEIFLPRNYGITSLNLTNIALGIQNVRANTTWWNPNAAHNTDTHLIDVSEVASANPPMLAAGEYAVISRAVAAGVGTNAAVYPPPATTGAQTRFYLARDNFNSFYEFAPANGGLALTNTLSINTGNIADMNSMEIDDPRLGQHPLDWVKMSGNTFGRVNARSTVGKSPSTAVGIPEQDTDNGSISDSSLYMPPPKGTTFLRSDGTIDDNIAGRVQSVGELGFIHTGYESCSSFMGSPIPPGISWRTIRLQPSASSTSVVPDWAIMDLFTAPIAAPNQYNKYVYAPHDTSFGGRVNLNSKAEPFGLPRTAPLAAVLQNATYDFTDLTKKISPSTAATIADSIFNRTLATTTPVGKQYGYAEGYDSPGEIVEMRGVADTGEKSEELVRQIANLVTARGNVFAVYTVGQAIKQTPSGKLTVTAEQRTQAVVERYLDSTNNQVRFAPVYFRNLSP